MKFIYNHKAIPFHTFIIYYSLLILVEAAGGSCLPCVVDIREEAQVQDAVDKAVKTFGGIDIVVNNASAISLTRTLDTSMKK